MKTRHFINFHISGFTYYDGAEVFNQLEVGTKLNLKFEPENKFDNYAVAIYFKDRKLGFIPRIMNKEISKFLELGYDSIFETTINQISTMLNPEAQIGVIVKLKENLK